MKLPTDRLRAPSAAPRAAALLAAAFFAAAAGCQSHCYNASSLPPDLAAAPTTDVHRLDLSFMAQRSASSESIQPGDLLSVTIAHGAEEDEPATYPLRVDERGIVELPLIGNVPVAGLEPVGAEAAIRRASIERGIYVRPAVSVVMETRRSNQVTVLGAVETPGTYPLPAAESNLLASLVAAGGLTEDADTIVEVRQAQQGTATLPLQGPSGPSDGSAVPAAFESAAGVAASTRRIDLAKVAPGQADYRLGDGAVVTVMARPPQTVQVIGLVNRPDQFDIPPGQDVRLLDALALAGGRTLQVADKVRVIRNLPDRSEPAVITASVRGAKSNGGENIRLAPGDVVSVEETPLTFTLEMLRSFMRFGFSSAMPGF